MWFVFIDITYQTWINNVPILGKFSGRFYENHTYCGHIQCDDVWNRFRSIPNPKAYQFHIWVLLDMFKLVSGNLRIENGRLEIYFKLQIAYNIVIEWSTSVIRQYHLKIDMQGSMANQRDLVRRDYAPQGWHSLLMVKFNELNSSSIQGEIEKEKIAGVTFS